MKMNMNPLHGLFRTLGVRSLGLSWRWGLLVALLPGAFASAATPTPSVSQGLVDPPSAEHHVGKFIFVELVTPDLAASKQFYGGLFGWNFPVLQSGAADYIDAFLDGHPVARLAQREIRANSRRQPAWLGFIAVSDVEAARKAALLNGGKLLAAPYAVPDRGRAAVFTDPQGAVFGVLASSTGDPPDVLADPGEWIWQSLLTEDPDAAAAFYQKVFDYEVFEMPADAARQHMLLASEDYARASANTAPPAAEPTHPHWLNYVRVDNAVESAARAVTLGGKVLVKPRMDRQGGMVAVIADPQGAPVGLLEWPETDDRKAAP
jgi:predicted enzyme related to lactoylglutathione lyase